STDRSTDALTTRPRTTVESPRGRVECSVHSSAEGEEATLGGRTKVLCSRRIPSSSNSPISGGYGVPLALTRSWSDSGARFTTNSPVASTLTRESLRPTDVNCTIGGSTQEMVKNECGAKLSTPSAEVVEIQAMGRGRIRAVIRLLGVETPSFRAGRKRLSPSRQELTKNLLGCEAWPGARCGGRAGTASNTPV